MRRSLLILFAALLVAAAGALAVRLVRSRTPPLATSPTRGLAARVSDPAFDRHRPLAPGGEAVPLETLAWLESHGDVELLGEAELAGGDVARGSAHLQSAPDSPSLRVDQAAAALASRQPERALALVDGLLADRSTAKAPRLQGQALWNRALALEALDLGLGAAATFDRVAALGEPGWSDEARARAGALRQQRSARDAAWSRASTAGKQLAASAVPPPPELAAAFPGLMHHYLYHAVRMAPSAEALRKLLPLAETIDRARGAPLLAPYVTGAAATADFARRAPLVDVYRRLQSNPAALSPTEYERYLDRLQAARENDLLLGALLLNRTHLPARPALFRRLAEERRDPWFLAIVAESEAQRAVEAGQPSVAEHILLEANEACRAARIPYRCSYLETALTHLYEEMYRVGEAQSMAQLGLADSRAAGVNPVTHEERLLFLLGAVHRLRGETPLMQAYFEEALLRFPKDCDARRYAGEMIAEQHIASFDFDVAAEELARAPGCDEPPSLVRLNLSGALVRGGRALPPGVDLGDAALEARRARVMPTQRRFVDLYAGRLRIDGDRRAGQAALARALDGAAAAPAWDTDARRVLVEAERTLAVDAARAGEWPSAFEHAAAAAAAPPEPRCALAIVTDEQRAVTVVRDAAGATSGRYLAMRRHADIDPAELAPAELTARLHGCPTVAVFAPRPVHGTPRLLPPELAWSYRMGHARPTATAAVTAPERLIIADTVPPPSLHLAPLSPYPREEAAGARLITGHDATPARVLAAMTTATEIEIDAHGLVDLGVSDASMVVLSPDADGRFALTASDLRRQRFAGAPVVYLASCMGAQIAPYFHEPWSLPMAFIDAGARAVIASSELIPDRESSAVVAAIRARIRRGEAPAAALRDERMALLARDPHSWIASLLIFE